MLNITLLKCENLKKELELEDQYKAFVTSLYQQVKANELISPEQQAIEIEEQIFDCALRLNLNVAGISDRKIFVVKRDSLFTEHPFNIGSFYSTNAENGINIILSEFRQKTLEEIFGYSLEKIIGNFYFQPNWEESLININKTISSLSIFANQSSSITWVVDGLEIVKNTIELVLKQSDRDKFYFQWVYNEMQSNE